MIPKLKATHVSPNAEEENAINAGLAADLEARELDGAWFATAQPASKAFAPETYTALLALKRPRGRQKVEEPKVFTAIRLDADLLAAYKATGKGWQSRVNVALRQYVEEHPIS